MAPRRPRRRRRLPFAPGRRYRSWRRTPLPPLSRGASRPQQQQARCRSAARFRQRIGLGPRPAELLLKPSQLRLCLTGDQGLALIIEHEVDHAPDRPVHRHLRQRVPAAMDDGLHLLDHRRLDVVADERTAVGVQPESEVHAHGGAHTGEGLQPRLACAGLDGLDVAARDAGSIRETTQADAGVLPGLSQVSGEIVAQPPCSPGRIPLDRRPWDAALKMSHGSSVALTAFLGLHQRPAWALRRRGYGRGRGTP